MKNIKLFVTFVASLFFLFFSLARKKKLKLVDLTRSDSQSLS